MRQQSYFNYFSFYVINEWEYYFAQSHSAEEKKKLDLNPSMTLELTFLAINSTIFQDLFRVDIQKCI